MTTPPQPRPERIKTEQQLECCGGVDSNQSGQWIPAAGAPQVPACAWCKNSRRYWRDETPD